jgi:chromosomal replication initiator protein
VKEQLRQEIPRANYENWVKQAVGVDYDENVLTIGVENEYARDWLEDRLSATVRRMVTGISAKKSEIRFIVI